MNALEWKNETPQPADEQHILKGNYFRIVLSRKNPSDKWGGYADTTKYGVTGYATTNLDEAKETSLRNYRDYLAAALAEIDAVMESEVVTGPAEVIVEVTA